MPVGHPRRLAAGAAIALAAATLAAAPTASAAVVPQGTTLYFHSANGGYANDFRADPSGAGTGQAPAGSTLTAAPPSKTAEATATYAGPQTSGTAGVPTFRLPAESVGDVSSVCLDLWLTKVPDAATTVNVLSRFVAPSTLPGGTSNNNSVLTRPAKLDGSLVHVTGLVSTSKNPLSVGSGWAFALYDYLNSDPGLTLHYDATAVPSSITLNPVPGTCPVAVPSPVGGTASPTATYTSYTAPGALGKNAGEPSIGVNWKTGNVMFQSYTETLRVSGFDSADGPSWVNKPAPQTSVTSLDPILFTDSVTGRTFVSQLVGACSISAYTDDDGDSYSPSQGCGVPAGVDHQTIGGGPFPPGVTPSANYPRAVYYCSQDIDTAFCAMSRDGGTTYGQGVPIYTVVDCGGLHGHIRVGPNGQAYVPNKNCRGQRGGVVSTNGQTWRVFTIPGSTTRTGSDPSVAVGDKGTAYYGYQDGDGHAKVAVSRDNGVHWTTPIDVGAPLGIANTQFAEMIAGDDDQAAFAFLGTTTPGDDNAASFGQASDGKSYTGGTWKLYVSTTYDGGLTWSTVDAAPQNIIQRGCIWNGGGSNVCRNLLDFNDITVDKDGRVLVGLADGCTGACETSTLVADNPHSDKATIIRQASGRGLFARGDAALGNDPVAAVPEAPATPLLLLGGLGVLGVLVLARRRRAVG
jgi:hypothetical protein